MLLSLGGIWSHFTLELPGGYKEDLLVSDPPEGRARPGNSGRPPLRRLLNLCIIQPGEPSCVVHLLC